MAPLVSTTGAAFFSPAGFLDSNPSSCGVPTPYLTLLDATLRHLQDLAQEGVRHVEVPAEVLSALTHPLAPRAPAPQAQAAPGIRFSLKGADLGSSRPAPAPAPAPVPAAPVPSVPSAPTGDPASALAALREQALVCQRCPHLVTRRTQVVFGVGSPTAELMFVGEAPGADEDRQGEPFVGRAGQLLTRIITAMGRTRESVYIANILKCRPDMPPGQSGNRAPRTEEMDTCLPYLARQIEIIRPRVIVALGGTAVKGLLGDGLTIGAARGRWHDFRGTPVMPTFHPAYLLRAEDAPDKGIREKRKTWEDLLLAMERLGWPITDRMRGYFR